MLQIKRQYLQADSGADGGDVTATSDAQADGGATDSGSVEFTAEQQAKIQELISKAFAKGAAKAGKDASNGVEEKIAELEGKLAQAEHEKQIASTAAVMSAKGLVFSGDKSDVNIAFLYVPKKKEGTAVTVALP